MDTLASEALDSLTAAIQSLLPSVADPFLKPDLFINPLSQAPTGIGGFVAVSASPVGEIIGRRLEASVHVTVKADTVAQLGGAVSALTRAVLTVDRGALLKQGIQRISLSEMGPKSTVNVGGNKKIAEQELSFKVSYEFLQLPKEAEEIIDEIVLELDMPLGGAKPKSLFKSESMSGSLDQYEVIDILNPQNHKPSQWQYNPDEARIEQLSDIWGGSPLVNPNKSGTYLVLKATPGRLPIQDFSLQVRLQSDGNRGIGLVFRWQDLENFYFFLMDSLSNYRLLAKRVDGVFGNLDTEAFDKAKGYEPGKIYRIRITAQGSELRVFIDDNLALKAQDQSLPDAGRIGFMTHRNDKSYFYTINLTKL